MANSVSDHHPLLVSVSHSDAIKWKKYHFFRYKASWTKKQKHGEIIQKAWRVKQRMSDPWKMIHQKLNGCRRSLQIWVRKSENSIASQIQKKSLELHSIQMEANPETIEKGMVVKEELNSLIEQKDLHWSQRAKETG